MKKQLGIIILILCTVMVWAQPADVSNEKMRKAVENVVSQAPKIKVGDEWWSATRKRCSQESKDLRCIYTYKGSSQHAYMDVYVIYDENDRWDKAVDVLANELERQHRNLLLSEVKRKHKRILHSYEKHYSHPFAKNFWLSGAIVNLSDGVSARYYLERAADWQPEAKKNFAKITLPSIERFPKDAEEF